MNAFPALDLTATHRIIPLTERLDLLALLTDQYGVACEELETLDRTGLLRIADTFNFLANNLPPSALKK